jgi:hypothetical protein
MSYAADGPFPRNAFVADQKHPKSNPTHLNQPEPNKMTIVVSTQKSATSKSEALNAALLIR